MRLKNSTVAIITNSLPDVGQGRYAYELHKEVVKLGFDAELVYLGRHLKDYRTIEKVPLPRLIEHAFNFEFVYPRRIGDYRLYHLTNDDICRLLRHKKPSLITVLDMKRFMGLGGGGFLTKLSLKFSFNPELASKIITISEYTRKEFLRAFDVSPEMVVAIHLGVDRESFRPMPKNEAREKLGLGQDSFIVLNVGPERETKRTGLLLQAFSKLDQDAVLAKVGRRSAGYEKLIRDLGIEDRVLRPGSVHFEEIPLWYSAADVYIDLDTYPGFGLPLLESMSCGTPVICSNEGAFPEVVGDAGILVEPTIEAVLSNLERVLGREGLRRRLRKRGMKRSRNFSWKKTAQRTIGVYEQIFEEMHITL